MANEAPKTQAKADAETAPLGDPANFQFDSAVTAQRLNEQIQRTLRQFTGVTEVNVAVQDPGNRVLWSSPAQ